jgi:hypothetical protein
MQTKPAGSFPERRSIRSFAKRSRESAAATSKARGASPEWDKFIGDGLSHAGYRQVVTGIVRIQSRLLNCTKFAWITRHCLANLHYLVTPEGLITLNELSPGWGLLEANQGQELILRKAPQIIRIQDSLSWLEYIAQSATRGWLRKDGLVGRSAGEQTTLGL